MPFATLTAATCISGQSAGHRLERRPVQVGCTMHVWVCNRGKRARWLFAERERERRWQPDLGARHELTQVPLPRR
jgi:hypothetical protein